MDLGLDKDKNFVYEGSGLYGHALWPSPIIVPAAFRSSQQDNPEPADNSLDPGTFIFRENSFDLANRVRRGTFYKAGETQPVAWRVFPHPALPQEARHERVIGKLEKYLFTFYQYRAIRMQSDFGDAQPLVLLGTKDSFTIWSIASIE
ncbi:MAG: hypothetical protein J5I92_11440, partial [Thiogranum sp.]|nr:hypothetical protein [Thiogranum sp.]